MRLKSPFKDYYDGCLKLDNEAEPLYVRKTEYKDSTTSNGKYYIYNPHVGRRNIGELYINTFIIGIGTVIKRGLFVSRNCVNERICYSTEEVRQYIGSYFSNKALRDFDKRSGYRNLGHWGYGLFSARVDEYFSGNNEVVTYKNISTVAMPIWVIDTRDPKLDLVSNARLASYDFARIVPPYQAYQELRTYLCNQAAPREFIPPISDSDMLVAKGFNKDSFKDNKPGGPARKRRKNKGKEA